MVKAYTIFSAISNPLKDEKDASKKIYEHFLQFAPLKAMEISSISISQQC